MKVKGWSHNNQLKSKYLASILQRKNEPRISFHKACIISSLRTQGARTGI